MPTQRYDYFSSYPAITFLGLESLTSSGPISITIPTTEIADYSYNGVYTLADNTVGGFIKKIYIQNLSMSSVINLSRGSFVLNQYNPSITLEWDSTADSAGNGNWRVISSYYPPLFVATQQGTKLVGTGYSGTSFYGNNTAIGGDSNTISVGSYNDNGGNGATWIFTRTGTIWTQQGSKLLGTGNTGAAQQQGQSLSGDSNTLSMGAPNDGGQLGAAWVFTRTGTVWSQQGPKLVGTGYSSSICWQGYGGGTNVSFDSNTLTVGGYQDGGGTGAVWVFTRPTGGTVWTQQAKLVGTGYSGTSTHQNNTSLSANGNILAIGGPGDASNVGATWIFTRTGTVWTQQGTKLIGTGFSAASQGNVALNSDGTTLAVAGNGDNSGVGAVWIFTRSGTVWTQQGTKLVGTGYSGNGAQGFSLALTADGNTLISGSNGDNSVGAFWIFTRTNGVWTQQGNKIVGTGYTAPTNQGLSCAISPNGTTFAISSNNDATTGGTWVFN